MRVFLFLLACEGVLILWTLRLPGGALRAAFDGRILDFFLWNLGPWFVLLLATVFLRVRKAHRIRSRHGLAVGVVVSLLLAGAMVVAGIRIRLAHSYRPGLGIYLYQPGSTNRVCPSRDPCWSYAIDEHGLRNPPGHAVMAGAGAVALVGDSFVFGVGVNDGETLAAELERRLATANGPRVRVINAGIPGTSLASFPALARHALERYAVSAVVVLMNYGDVVPLDMNARLNRVRDHLGWRLLAALDLEVAWEYLFWMRGIPPVPDARARADLTARLDDLRQACAGRRLLLVTDWPLGYLPLLEAWIERNPTVGWFDVTNHLAWKEAETLPHDAHWSARGISQIASLLLDPVSQTLDKDRSAVRLSWRGRSPPAESETAVRPFPDLAFLPPERFTQSRLSGQPEALILGVRLADGRADLRVEWCADHRRAFAIGAVCFSFLGPISPERDLAVRGALEPFGDALRALAP